ncbi:MAG: helix-turn-helix domain-containing protein [Nanoarchaeota archaeon]
MEDNNFILMSLEDEKSKDLADVLGNKTCKKIINYLAEIKSASAKDISDELEIGMSGVDYNIKKLLKSGLVEKKKDFFWSKKGKKIVMYKVSNKSVIISPKNSEISSKLKSLLPVVLLTGVSTFGVYVFEKIKGTPAMIQKGVSTDAPSIRDGIYESMVNNEIAGVVSQEIVSNAGGNLWIWFLSGAVLTLIIFTIVNWKKI